MRSTLRSAALASLAILALGSAAHGQEARPGWIGISYEARESRSGEARVVITDVRRGSPAESAGVRAGDRLVAIEDVTGMDELMGLSKRLTLRAGQLVQMRLERDGRPLALRIRAAERPTELSSNVAIRMSLQTDSMTETMFLAMDSLRAHLLETSGRGVARARASAAPGQASSRLTVLAPGGRETVNAPFEFFVFRGEQHDSLIREMERLNLELQQLRSREGERVQELRRERRGPRAEEQDRRLAELRGTIEQLTRQSAELRGEMAEAARATAGWEYLLPPAPQASPAPPAPRPETYRPLTPYLLGSDRVAGAQVVGVQPELGVYFGVENGVLIVDVSPGTPAAIAGMRPGDVVTRLDQVTVRTVEDLRFGVSQAGDTLPITLIRQGTSLQVLLRRR